VGCAASRIYSTAIRATNLSSMKATAGNHSSRPRKVLALIGFPVLLAAVIVPVIVFRNELWVLFTSIKRLEEWVRASGPVAPLVFVAIQVFQVVIFVVPGEVAQVAGGYLFGTWLGTLYSVVGLAIGSAVDFYLARYLGVPFVNALFSREKVEKLRAPLGSPGAKVVLFLLFLIPGVPKDALCYVSGLSPLRFRFFLLASMAGRLPGIIGSSLIGSSAADQKWVLAGSVMVGAVVLFSAGFLLRKHIEVWLGGVGEHRNRSRK
jgi:uncharacterized membrane protein YdjX (TVP38/TMEM64 family)